MDIIYINLSAWVSVLNPIFQKMSSIKWTMFLFNMNTFFVLSPITEYLNKNNAIRQLEVNQEQQETRSDITYTLTLAASSSSRVFSLVGCHIGISKYFSRYGQTTLSRTKNKKNLPQSEMWDNGIARTYALHLPQDRSWRFYPVLSGPLRSEQINRDAVLRMRLDAAIKATQIGQNVMRKAVVMLVKRTLPGIINFRLDSAPPVSGLDVVFYNLYDWS